MRIFKMSFAMAILAGVYYPVVLMAFTGHVHWPYLVGLPLFAAYCLHFEASTSALMLLDDALVVNAARGGMLKSTKQRRTYLPYSDIVKLAEHDGIIEIRMAYIIELNKASLFSKRVATDTFLLRPADKYAFMAALRSKVGEGRSVGTA